MEINILLLLLLIRQIYLSDTQILFKYPLKIKLQFIFVIIYKMFLLHLNIIICLKD